MTKDQARISQKLLDSATPEQLERMIIDRPWVGMVLKAEGDVLTVVWPPQDRSRLRIGPELAPRNEDGRASLKNRNPQSTDRTRETTR